MEIGGITDQRFSLETQEKLVSFQSESLALKIYFNLFLYYQPTSDLPMVTLQAHTDSSKNSY